MTRPHRLCYERACALQGKYTINIQSNDGETMFGGLHALMEQADFNDHLHRTDDYWCAIVSTNDRDLIETLSERLAISRYRCFGRSSCRAFSVDVHPRLCSISFALNPSPFFLNS